MLKMKIFNSKTFRRYIAHYHRETNELPAFITVYILSESLTENDKRVIEGVFYLQRTVGTFANVISCR